MKVCFKITKCKNCTENCLFPENYIISYDDYTIFISAVQEKPYQWKSKYAHFYIIVYST